MGDLVGTRQHGETELRIADLPRDAKLLARARAAAESVLETDPDLKRPEHARLRAHLEAAWRERGMLAEIG
jgi:ATP-dependent DNA helicase RecG